MTGRIPPPALPSALTDKGGINMLGFGVSPVTNGPVLPLTTSFSLAGQTWPIKGRRGGFNTNGMNPNVPVVHSYLVERERRDRPDEVLTPHQYVFARRAIDARGDPPQTCFLKTVSDMNFYLFNKRMLEKHRTAELIKSYWNPMGVVDVVKPLQNKSKYRHRLRNVSLIVGSRARVFNLWMAAQPAPVAADGENLTLWLVLRRIDIQPGDDQSIYGEMEYKSKLPVEITLKLALDKMDLIEYQKAQRKEKEKQTMINNNNSPPLPPAVQTTPSSPPQSPSSPESKYGLGAQSTLANNVSISPGMEFAGKYAGPPQLSAVSSPPPKSPVAGPSAEIYEVLQQYPPQASEEDPKQKGFAIFASAQPQPSPPAAAASASAASQLSTSNANKNMDAKHNPQAKAVKPQSPPTKGWFKSTQSEDPQYDGLIDSLGVEDSTLSTTTGSHWDESFEREDESELRDYNERMSRIPKANRKHYGTYWRWEPYVTYDRSEPPQEVLMDIVNSDWVGMYINVGTSSWIHDPNVNKSEVAKHFVYPKSNDDWMKLVPQMPALDVFVHV